MSDEVANAPSAARTAKQRQPVKCAECGQPFTPSRAGQRFCPAAPGSRNSACAKEWGNRNTTRGGPVVPLLMAWATTRHAKPGTREAEVNRYARRELTEAARLFAAEDGKEGRAAMVDYVASLMDAKTLFVDRRRA